VGVRNTITDLDREVLLRLEGAERQFRRLTMRHNILTPHFGRIPYHFGCITHHCKCE
jgi:hypothetical protein